MRHLRALPEPLSAKIAREAADDVRRHGWRTFLPVRNTVEIKRPLRLERPQS